MKLSNVIVAFLFIIFFVGCEKPKEKSPLELYEEAKILLTDIEKGDPVKALEILNNVISLEPKPDFIVDAYLSRAGAYVSLGENEKAFEDFNAALQINPDVPDIYLKRGEMYSDLKQYEMAVEDYNHAIRLQSNYANAYFERGKLYFTRGEYKKAYDDFAATLSIDPSHTEASLYIDEVRPLIPK